MNLDSLLQVVESLDGHYKDFVSKHVELHESLFVGASRVLDYSDSTDDAWDEFIDKLIANAISLNENDTYRPILQGKLMNEIEWAVSAYDGKDMIFHLDRIQSIIWSARRVLLVAKSWKAAGL
jgi:hypothetical protein